MVADARTIVWAKRPPVHEGLVKQQWDGAPILQTEQHGGAPTYDLCIQTQRVDIRFT